MGFLEASGLKVKFPKFSLKHGLPESSWGQFTDYALNIPCTGFNDL